MAMKDDEVEGDSSDDEDRVSTGILLQFTDDMIMDLL
jgi:hypothetical protein